VHSVGVGVELSLVIFPVTIGRRREEWECAI
jgi:hypothetical protein